MVTIMIRTSNSADFNWHLELYPVYSFKNFKGASYICRKNQIKPYTMGNLYLQHKMPQKITSTALRPALEMQQTII